MLNEVDQEDCRPLLECEILIDEMMRALRKRPMQAQRSCGRSRASMLVPMLSSGMEEIIAGIQASILEIKRQIQRLMGLTGPISPATKTLISAAKKQISTAQKQVAVLRDWGKTREFRVQSRTVRRSRGFFSQAKVNARNAP